MDGSAIVAIVFSTLASLVGALVLLNLQSISKCIRGLTGRVDKHDDELKDVRQVMSTCKVDCDRNTVSKEDWVRSEGYTRRGIEKLSEQMAGLDGKMCVVEKLPEIAGTIARSVAQEMKKGDRA